MCSRPAVAGRPVFRTYGDLGGVPEGNQNWFAHGRFSAAAMADGIFQRRIEWAIRACADLSKLAACLLLLFMPSQVWSQSQWPVIDGWEVALLRPNDGGAPVCLATHGELFSRRGEDVFAFHIVPATNEAVLAVKWHQPFEPQRTISVFADGNLVAALAVPPPQRSSSGQILGTIYSYTGRIPPGLLVSFLDALENRHILTVFAGQSGRSVPIEHFKETRRQLTECFKLAVQPRR